MLKALLPPTSPFCDTADFLMFDNFPGTPSALTGKSPVVGSGTWQVAANPDRALSGNGSLYFGPGSGIDTAYGQIALTDIPGEIGCTFQFAGPPTPSPTLSCYPVLNDFGNNNFHFQVGPTDLGFTYWMNGPPPSIPAWNVYNVYAPLSPNELYTFRVFIDAPYAHGFLFDSTGTLVGYRTINEPNMANVIGPFMFVQLFNDSLVYRSVWARKKAENSALASASLIRAAALHIGGGVPSGVFSARYDGATERQAPTIAATTIDAELAIKAESGGYAARLILSTSYPPFALTAATVFNGGAGYQPNDLLKVEGGTPHSVGAEAHLRVDGIGPGGAVIAVSVAVPGLYDLPPTGPVFVTNLTGTGTGATFTTPTSIGTTPVSSSIELTASVAVVFNDIFGQPWLTKPSPQGTPGSDYPYVPGGIRIGGATGPIWLSGSGAPTVPAPVGSLYSRTDGGSGSSLYVMESGGWMPK